MTRKSAFLAALCLTVFWIPSAAQSVSDKGAPPTSKPAEAKKPADPENMDSRIEHYLRNLYAWGPDFEVKIGTSKPSPIPELLEVPVTVSMGGQSDSAVVYVTKSGRYLVRGELSDMTADPFADVSSKLHAGTSPSMGPADAKVTLIEFADFECPSCRQLDLVLRDLLLKHPEVRLVFKQFPLTDIHPWAMTAALATQCAYQQNPAAFWKMHDAIFDAQDSINPENASDKLLALATQFGVDPDTYRTCMSNPDTANQVKAAIDEGHALSINATPTTFVNNRRVVGPDKSLIQQDMSFARDANL